MTCKTGLKVCDGLTLAVVISAVGLSGRSARADLAYAWGLNTHGGDYFSLAIRNGGVYGWGNNLGGELGDGTTIDRHTPVQVLGLSSGVTAIAAGGGNGLAVKNGGVFAWGYDTGDGTTMIRTTPVAVPGFSSGVTAIAVGQYHSLVVQNGGVFAWGNNGWGQLGDGTLDERDSPVAVTGLSSDVTAIAAGGGHSLAVKNGGVYAWGENILGALGDGTTTDQHLPEPHRCVRPDPASFPLPPASTAATRFLPMAACGCGAAIPPASSVSVAAAPISWTPLRRLLPPTGYLFTSIDADDDGIHALATLAAVPEPASLGILCLGGIAFLPATADAHPPRPGRVNENPCTKPRNHTT